MKIMFIVLAALCVVGLSWSGCSSSTPSHEGMINYNGEWITTEEYTRIKSGEFEPPESTPSPSPQVPVPKPNPEPPPPISDWEIIDLDYEITEKNNSWWRFSYVLELKNNTNHSLSFIVVVQFLDSGGFVVDDSLVEVDLNAGQSKTFRDYGLIDADTAPNVRSAEAKEY